MVVDTRKIGVTLKLQNEDKSIPLQLMLSQGNKFKMQIHSKTYIHIYKYIYVLKFSRNCTKSFFVISFLYIIFVHMYKGRE